MGKPVCLLTQISCTVVEDTMTTRVVVHAECPCGWVFNQELDQASRMTSDEDLSAILYRQHEQDTQAVLNGGPPNGD